MLIELTNDIDGEVEDFDTDDIENETPERVQAAFMALRCELEDARSAFRFRTEAHTAIGLSFVDAGEILVIITDRAKATEWYAGAMEDCSAPPREKTMKEHRAEKFKSGWGGYTGD